MPLVKTLKIDVIISFGNPRHSDEFSQQKSVLSGKLVTDNINIKIIIKPQISFSCFLIIFI